MWSHGKVWCGRTAKSDVVAQQSLMWSHGKVWCGRMFADIKVVLCWGDVTELWGLPDLLPQGGLRLQGQGLLLYGHYGGGGQGSQAISRLLMLQIEPKEMGFKLSLKRERTCKKHPVCKLYSADIKIPSYHPTYGSRQLFHIKGSFQVYKVTPLFFSFSWPK